MKKKRIILGCGYVGTAVAEKWLSEGCEVWGVSRNADTLGRIHSPGFHGVVAEVDSPDWHDQVPRSPEVVLNCVSSAGGGAEGYRKSYLGGNRSLLDWARTAKPEKILYTSSTAVYPFTDGREVREEDTGGSDLSETGALVLESENILLEDSVCGPLTTVLRLSGIYGPGRHYLLDQIRSGEGVIAGRGDYFLNLIFLEDIVSAVRALMEAPRAGGRAYNVSDGHPVRKEELADWLAARLGLPPPVFDPGAQSRRRMRINRAGSSPNRRILIDRIRSEAGWSPSFASYREGFAQLGING